MKTAMLRAGRECTFDHDAIDAMLRERFDLSHRQVAALIGCSHQLVAEVAANGRVPSRCRRCGADILRRRRKCAACQKEARRCSEAKHRAMHPYVSQLRAPAVVKTKVIEALGCNPGMTAKGVAVLCGCSLVYVYKIKQGVR